MAVCNHISSSRILFKSEPGGDTMLLLFVTILQVRMKLVEDWLPVLRVCKENVSAGMSNYKSLYLELEETFLKITSTLPMSDSQMLLKECLSFSTRDIDDCPHLVTAFNTWFRRAKHPPPTYPADNIS